MSLAVVLGQYCITVLTTSSVQLVERTFTFPDDLALPTATFDAWRKLADALSACGQLSRRQQLLLNPITHAFKSDKRHTVHQVASQSASAAQVCHLCCWQLYATTFGNKPAYTFASTTSCSLAHHHVCSC